MDKDIMVCGVGGQGTVLASKILAAAAMREGNRVASAETIGMAQRGGSVNSHVRIGEQAYSPLIPLGAADIILSFEPAEAVRNMIYLKKDGLIISSNMPVKPVTESLMPTGYDGRECLEYIEKKADHIIIDAQEVCKPFGSSRFFNIIILGVACGSERLGIEKATLIEEIKERVPERFVDINLLAFEAGYKLGKEKR